MGAGDIRIVENEKVARMQAARAVPGHYRFHVEIQHANENRTSQGLRGHVTFVIRDGG